MLSTSPLWTPRNLTLAPFSITNPARSETSVSDSVRLSAPENNSPVMVLIATITRRSTGAHQMGSILARRAELLTPSPRQVEVAGLPVDGQRDGQQDEHACGDRQT